MKKKFIGFYNPTTEEIEEAWKNGIFAFDANTLLNLYRYTDNTRTDFLSALKTIKEKLFLPYQVAYEYHNNRLEVIDGVENSYENIYSIFPENFEKHLSSQINQYKKHPSIIIDKIIKLHNDFLENLSKELSNQKTKHPDFKTKDDVLNELTNLFDKSVGEDFSKEELLKIYKDGEIRYANEVPPGYKDLPIKKNKGQRNLYGDLIIWMELLNYTKNKKQPLVFITDDRKEDWWTIQKGKTIRPREELILEFFNFTGIRILIYNADNFLAYAKEKGLLPALKDETIEEVKDVRVNDEIRYEKWSEIIKNQAINSKNISEMFNRQSYKPIDYSEILKTQSQALSATSLSELFNSQTYKPIDISEILKNQSQALTATSLSELFNSQTYKPIDISEILKNQSQALTATNLFNTQINKPINFADIQSRPKAVLSKKTDRIIPEEKKPLFPKNNNDIIKPNPKVDDKNK